MKKIGIITAMQEEFSVIEELMSNVEIINKYNLKIYSGIINNKEVVLVQCGVGKVNSARTTQILIDTFEIEYIINVGVAGSLNEKLEIGDILIGKNLVQHDFDITAGGHPKGYISKELGREFFSNNKLINKCEEIIKNDLKEELKDITIDMLGRAKQIKTNKDSTIIVDGLGNKKEITDRIEEIKRQIASDAISSNLKLQLQERLAKLAGGVAVIKVGATTEVEMKEKKLRIEDALAATKAAVEEGIVAGGGTAYVDIIPNVRKVVSKLDDAEKIGGNIILKALETPLKQIAINAGDEPAIIFDKVASSKVGIGYNAATGELVDMKEVGIVDPAKVTRTALENAVSVSKMILTTESIVTDKVAE